jgi:iron complex outermembrane receptor protein
VDSYTLTQTFELSIGEITLISNKREIESYNGSWGWNYGNGPGISGNANLLDVINNPSEIEVESHELRLTGSSDSFDWVIGAYIFEENAIESIDVPIFRGVLPPPATLWPVFYIPGLADIVLGTQAYGSRNQGYIVTNENDAFYAEGTYQISDQLDLTVGVRRTNDDRYFERWQTLYGGAFDPTYFCPGMPSAEVAPGVVVPLSDRCTQTVSYSETTPRAILGYQYDDDTLFYTSYSKGYSSGGFNQDTRMRPFLPEISDNIEIGFKTTLRDGKVRLNGTYFNNSYENQQLTVGRLVDGQPTADLINAQEATLSGLELELMAQLSESWSMTLAYGHLEGEYDKFTVEDNVFTNAADGSLVESIVTRDLSHIEFGNGGDTDTLDVSFIYTTSLPSGGDLVSVIGATKKDDQYFSLENTPTSFTPGYTLVDGRINWNLSDGVTKISFWGKNLTDKQYVYNMLDQAGDVRIGGTDPGLGMAADYWGAPRRLGVEFRRDF